jgi:hypothetical protein
MPRSSKKFLPRIPTSLQHSIFNGDTLQAVAVFVPVHDIYVMLTSCMGSEASRRFWTPCQPSLRTKHVELLKLCKQLYTLHRGALWIELSTSAMCKHRSSLVPKSRREEREKKRKSRRKEEQRAIDYHFKFKLDLKLFLRQQWAQGCREKIQRKA